MGTFFEKQNSSRIIKNQWLNWAGTGTSFTTNFTNETWQIRVVAPVAGYISIIPTTADATVATTAGGTGTFIPASLPEYFTVSPGLILGYASTTTSTVPIPAVFVTEMA